MDAMLIILLTCVFLVMFITFVTVPLVRDAKIDINRNICRDKIRYAEEKAKIEIRALEEKKRKGLYPFSTPPPSQK